MIIIIPLLVFLSSLLPTFSFTSTSWLSPFTLMSLVLFCVVLYHFYLPGIYRKSIAIWHSPYVYELTVFPGQSVEDQLSLSYNLCASLISLVLNCQYLAQNIGYRCIPWSELAYSWEKHPGEVVGKVLANGFSVTKNPTEGKQMM